MTQHHGLKPLLLALYMQAQSDLVSQTMSRIKYTVNTEESVSGDCDLLVEAIIENMDIKKDLFSKLDKIAPRYLKICSKILPLSLPPSIYLFVVQQYLLVILRLSPSLRWLVSRIEETDLEVYTSSIQWLS